MKNKEILIKNGLFSISLVSFSVIMIMTLFLILESAPIFLNYGVHNFISGIVWAPDLNRFGIFPMIISTLLITAISLSIAVPLSIFCAIFLEEIAPRRIRLFFKPAIQVLAGIPSVVYGFFGLTVLVPFMRDNFGGSGFSIISASLILSVMILPTVISVSQDSIKSVSSSLKEASLALGSTHFQAIQYVIIPQAFTGIFTAVVLGVSRAVGETLAVLMIVGNVAQIPDSIFDPARTLTSNIALEMSYATGIHYNALFATSLILLIVIISVMFILNAVKNKWGY